MAKNEKTSAKVASVAAKALKSPAKATTKDIKTIAGSVLTQAADKPKPKPAAKKKP